MPDLAKKPVRNKWKMDLDISRNQFEKVYLLDRIVFSLTLPILQIFANDLRVDKVQKFIT